MTDLRRTPLYDSHVALGGQMVPFAGWEMPVQYAGLGLVAEHNATRTAAGLFDVSHMGEIVVEGVGATDELNWLVSNDVSTLGEGEAQYALLCHPHGGTVDDLFIYRLGPERFLVVVNAANTAKDFAFMQAHARRPELAQRAAHHGDLEARHPACGDLGRHLDRHGDVGVVHHLHVRREARDGHAPLHAPLGEPHHGDGLGDDAIELRELGLGAAHRQRAGSHRGRAHEHEPGRRATVEPRLDRQRALRSLRPRERQRVGLLRQPGR